MRYKDRRRDSKAFIVVDEDCGVPTSLVDGFSESQDHGPLAQSDPRSLLLSMSEYDKPSNFNVYEYNQATRPEQGQEYAGYAAHHSYNGQYVGAQSQVPSGLPQSAAAFDPTPPTPHYASHGSNYYSPQNPQYPGYVQTAAAPRPLPEITSYEPRQGHVGTEVTVYFRSIYNFDVPPVTPFIMFGQKKCAGVLSRVDQPGQAFQYSLTADAPPLTPISTPSPQVPLSITFDESDVTWQADSLQFGHFTYLDQPGFYPLNPTPQLTAKKRKLSPEAPERRSPTKKPSLQQLSGPVSAIPTASPVSPFRRPNPADAYSQARRFSGPDFHHNYNPGLRSTQSQYFYSSAQQTPSLQAIQSPSWSHRSNTVNRSPSSAIPGSSKASLLPSPASNPPLIRTSTLQQPPVTPSVSASTPPQSFNPYTQYAANSKATLKLDGDMNTMTQRWTNEEREAGRRLVQFRRSQSGSTITATFEAVTLEDRIPNSICVSCIWWEQKEDCYVTSVDTISLLESLVAVRFTVEEKNRIRRNLEGFRPMTVSKAKAESDDFFKLIMGFPNPKPRNIEKDVKVFPWRILGGALKKIIGKYSASYASTAGALHTSGAAGSNYPASRASDSSAEPPQRLVASPHSTSSSATSHAYAPPTIPNPYSAHSVASSAGLGVAPLMAPSSDLRLTVPVSAPGQTGPPWQPPVPHYANESGATRGWEFSGGYLQPLPALTMPNVAAAVAQPGTILPHPTRSFSQYAQDAPPGPNQLTMPPITRFVPLHNYEEQQSQQTSNS